MPTTKPIPKAQPVSKKIATPAEMLAAAEAAPAVFHISAYFRPIYVMRQKGHSWRDLVKWLQQFNVDVSHAHLRRLYMHEDRRLSRLTEKELRKMGMPEKMIKEVLGKDDPTDRLPAPDPTTSKSEERS